MRITTIPQARRFLGMCEKRILVITGAGISAESGIPTFQGEGQRWRNQDVRMLATPEAFERDPRFIWDWYLYRRGVVAKAEPNKAHRALAEWAKRLPGVITLVTQNVDGLHERAGHPDVLRIHGSLWHNRCTQCDREREESSLAYAELPRSPCCDALERPAITWFGEALPKQARERSLEAAMEAEAVITIGTSGQVATANQLVRLAKARCAEVFDVNPELSCIDAHTRFAGTAGEVVPALVAV
jgi:NAD-dependent deacetylase